MKGTSETQALWNPPLPMPGRPWSVNIVSGIRAAILTRISPIFNIPEARIRSSGKESERVRAKSIAACWAVRELGPTGTQAGNHLNLTQSAVGRAVRRGEEIVKELGLSLVNEGNA